MIVCNICGDAVSELGSRCLGCSGKGIEKATPLKSLLTPTQRKGSPDRWARRYTTPPGRANGSPLAGASHNRTPSALAASTPNRPNHVDLRLQPEAELARVCGTVFDSSKAHPHCASCLEPIKLGGRLYIAPLDIGNVRASDTTCRSCYAKLFAIGACLACTKPIVGDREEGHLGAHIKGRGASMWHAACFRCAFCQSSLYRQEHLLTPLGKPACMPCFDKSHQPQPVQSPTVLDSVNSRRSYARPHSTQSMAPKPVSTPSQAESAPRLPREGSATIPATPRTRSKETGGHGSVRKLAARFDPNIPSEEGHFRDMKQIVAELDRYLGKDCG